MVLMRLVDRTLGLVSTLFLARMLLPADFGLVAMATLILGVLEIMGSFGFDIALIQNQRAARQHFDTAWTLTAMYGAASGLLLAVLAVPVAHFFHEPRLATILWIFSVVALVQGFENIGTVAFRKELDFQKEFTFRTLKRLVATVITIAAALAFRSYWALVVGIVVSRIVGVWISYVLHPYRPRFSLAAVGELWRFSAWLLFSNIVVFSAVRGYDFIIGRIAGSHALGVYSVAYDVANLPTSELVDPVARAVLPGLATLTEDVSQLRQKIVDLISLTALISFPLGFGIAVLAEPAVRLMLGPNWTEAIPIVRVLALYGVMRTALSGTGSAYLVQGATRSVAMINCTHLLIGWPLMLVFLPTLGLVGAGYAIVCASAVGIAINVYLARGVLGLPPRILAACLYRPALSGFVLVVFEASLLRLWPPAAGTGQLLLQTLGYVMAGAVAYLISAFSLWALSGRPAGAERIVLTKLSELAARRPPPREPAR